MTARAALMQCTHFAPTKKSKKNEVLMAARAALHTAGFGAVSGTALQGEALYVKASLQIVLPRLPEEHPMTVLAATMRGRRPSGTWWRSRPARGGVEEWASARM